MSADTVLKGAEFVLNTVSGHGTATVLHVAQCRTCSESSGLGEDEVRPAAVWTIQHTRAHPGHRHFWFTSRRRWRVDRHYGPPAPPAPSGDITAPVPPSAAPTARVPHANPRPKRCTRLPAPLQRAWNSVARLAGPLYLAGLCTAIGVVFLAAHAMGKS